MNKYEIALELAKLAYDDTAKNNHRSENEPASKVVTDLYNYIVKNMYYEE